MRWLVVALLGGCWRGPVPEPVAPPVVVAPVRPPARAVAVVGDELWVAMGTCDDAKIWKTADRGEHWKPIAPSPTGVERMVGGRHPGEVAVLGVTCVDGKPSTRHRVWTRDEGQNWREVDPPPGFRGGFVTMGFLARMLQFSWKDGETGGNWQLGTFGWMKVTWPVSGPPPSVKLGETIFRPSKAGLIVETGRRWKRVFPD